MNDNQSAIFLSEHLFDLNEGAGFLSDLPDETRVALRGAGSSLNLDKGNALFNQGSSHEGIWVIEKGRIRTYYTGPSGREITLAYWCSGHFVGGPEVFGRGRHIWSADALEDTHLLFVDGRQLRQLVYKHPDLSIAIIEGLIAKGKCYSALIQMLGTRSVSERLQLLLLILADTHGVVQNGEVVVSRSITFDQIASIVGASRQWVTQSMDAMRNDGVLNMTRKEIRILDVDRLACQS